MKPVAFQLGHFSFRSYPPPPKSRPVRAVRSVAIDAEPLPELQLTMLSCYFCCREGYHDVGCPGERIMRVGECWLVMNRHFEVVHVSDSSVVGHLSYASVRTTYSKVTLEMLRYQPKRIVDCPCRDPRRAHERIGW